MIGVEKSVLKSRHYEGYGSLGSSFGIQFPAQTTGKIILPGFLCFKLPFWFFDYLSPLDWVHGDLEQVDSGAALLDRDRSDPDAIMTGWNALGHLGHFLFGITFGQRSVLPDALVSLISSR